MLTLRLCATDDAERGWDCIDCPAGRSSCPPSNPDCLPTERRECAYCLPGFFALSALRPSESCLACTVNITIPSKSTYISKDSLTADVEKICPGGLPGETAGICPQRGLWLFAPRPSSTPEFFDCESSLACSDRHVGFDAALTRTECHSWLNTSAAQEGTAVVQPGGLCGNGYEGFMCGRCKAGWNKVASKCVPCPGTDWGMLALVLVQNFFIAFLLLHKSTKATVSSTEIEDIWYKVDLQRTKVLNQESVTRVLELMGVYVDSSEKVEQMMRKDFKATTRIDHGKETTELVIHLEEFVIARRQESPTAAMGTAIFFIQTFALLAEEAEYFKTADTLNMDAEATLGKCTTPLTYTERFVMKAVLTPVSVFLFIAVSAPLWNLLRRCGCMQKVWQKLKAPPSITREHVQRAALNAYMFCFAPLTRAAVEALLCKPTCKDTDTADCTVYLAKDMGVRCNEGQHITAIIMAVLVLLVFAVIIPIWLLKKVGRNRRQRDASLEMKATDVDKWFNELDEDNSGHLDFQEAKKLLDRMHEPTSKKSLRLFMMAIDPESEGIEDKFHVTRDEFKVWYAKQLENLVGTP
jgi:hypothetical protein